MMMTTPALLREPVSCGWAVAESTMDLQSSMSCHSVPHAVVTKPPVSLDEDEESNLYGASTRRPLVPRITAAQISKRGRRVGRSIPCIPVP